MRTTISHFLLVAVDVDKHRFAEPSAFKVATHRLTIAKWGLREKTKNRKAFKPGDKVLAYAAGKREFGGHIVGEAEIASVALPLEHSPAESVDSPTSNSAVVSEYFVKLKKCKLYEKPVDLRSIKEYLKFVKLPHSLKWGACLQNGCIRLPVDDFKLISNLAACAI